MRDLLVDEDEVQVQEFRAGMNLIPEGQLRNLWLNTALVKICTVVELYFCETMGTPDIPPLRRLMLVLYISK